MRVRHRIPSIFNLSMVDVLCCALGWVILLWLINLREAKQHEDNAEEEHRQIETELASIRAERDKTIGSLMEMEARIETLKEDKNALQNSLNLRLTEAAQSAQRLKKSAERVAALEGDLRERVKLRALETARADELDRKRKETAARVAVLEKELRAGEKRGEMETARSRELAESLTTARLRLKDVQASAKLLPALRDELKEAREQYAAEKALATALEKEIAKRQRAVTDADKELATLRQENKTLQGEATRMRSAVDNRFAGIELTGRRVLFLVDMSGSMDLVDENTKAPTKWADVRTTVARLMRSLPDLKQYQVLVFAERPAFLFEGEEDWLEYNPRSSSERVLNGLAKIVPKGGTNMYAALQTAFRLRAKGMDTIYLLSDGLPNLGEGIDVNALNALKEVERNDLLARHIRRTLQRDWNRPLSGQSRVRINAIGFFYESPDVGAFLWALARENEGSFVGMSKP